MLKKEIVAILVAAFCGLIAALMILNFLRSASQPKKEFVIAAVDLPIEHVITKNDIRYSSPEAVDASFNIENYFLLIPDAVGTKVVTPIRKGDLIKRKDVDFEFKVGQEEKKLKKVEVPKGMRALTLQAKDIRNMPAGVLVGDYIDILGMVSSSETGESLLKTIAFGTQIAGIELAEGSDQIKSVTVVLSQRDAEIVFKAIAISPLQVVITSGPEDKSIYGDSAGRIEIIRGITRSRK